MSKFFRLYSSFLPVCASLFFGLWISSASAAPQEELVDLKPHYAPVSAVEFFSTVDCAQCIKIQQLLNNLESSAGTRRGSVIFLTYTLLRTEAAQRTVDRAVSLQRERIQKRWNDYGQLWRTKKRALPQLMINGKKYSISSPADVLERAINKALIQPMKIAISVQLKSSTRETAKIDYSVVGLPKSRSDDLYLMTIIAVRPHSPVPVFSALGADNESVWANEVESLETLRIEEDDSGSVELQLPEASRSEVKQLVALLQDVRTGQLVSAETVNIKLSATAGIQSLEQ